MFVLLQQVLRCKIYIEPLFNCISIGLDFEIVKINKRHITTICVLGILLLTVFVLTSLMRDKVEYVDEQGNPLTACTRAFVGGDSIILQGDTYVVSENITCNGTITILGDVTLIIEDGCTLTVNAPHGDGIKAYDDNWNNYKITVYGQEKQTGTININSLDRGIWCRSFTLNGGNLNIQSSDWQSILAADTLLINNGIINAESSSTNCSAIRGDKSLTINGGQVTTTSKVAGLGSYQGDIMLGYTKSDDFIDTKGFRTYFGTVRVLEGKDLTDGTNVYSAADETSTLLKLKDVKLTPASSKR